MRVASEQIQLANEFKELWKGLMPSLGVPGDDQFLLWADIHSPERVTHGINRVARKARVMAQANTPMTTTDAVRYAASVMNNEAKGWRKFESGIKPKSIRPTVADADDNRGNRI